MKLNPFSPGGVWKFRAVVFAVNILVIAVFAGAGWLLDKQYGTSPKIVIGAVLLSFPVSQYALYKLIIKKD